MSEAPMCNVDKYTVMLDATKTLLRCTRVVFARQAAAYGVTLADMQPCFTTDCRHGLDTGIQSQRFLLIVQHIAFQAQWDNAGIGSLQTGCKARQRGAPWQVNCQVGLHGCCLRLGLRCCTLTSMCLASIRPLSFCVFCMTWCLRVHSR